MSSMSCPSCSKLNFADSKTCYSCNAPLRGGPGGGPTRPPPDGFQKQSASFGRDWTDASQIERTSFAGELNAFYSRSDRFGHLPVWQRVLLVFLLLGCLLLLNLVNSSKRVDSVGSNIADKWGFTFK